MPLCEDADLAVSVLDHVVSVHTDVLGLNMTVQEIWKSSASQTSLLHPDFGNCLIMYSLV